MSNKNFLILLLLVLAFDLSNVICQDESALLKAKTSRIVDPNGRLNDWIPGTHPCNWTGISCDSVSLDVTTINLSSFGLSGGFPSGFCGIKTLRSLDLGDNFFNGTVDLTHCSALRYLNLSLNCFVGGLPDFVGESHQLVGLDLSQNNFSGEIPPSYGKFPALRQLNLFSNLLDSVIPSFLGNLSELVEFNLAYNTFKPGPLPPEIGNLTKLENLWLPFSNLVGEIPASIGKLVNLRNLDLSDNDLAGAIPDSIGRLESVTQIELYRNRLSGTLPKSLGNLSSLKYFDASENALTGRVPERFAGLHMISLGLNDNYLQGEVPDSISRNPNLIVLKLFNNSFSGELPQELGRYSNLELFDVSSNGFVGELPIDLCRNGALRSLITFNNTLSGGLPESYGECESLSYIRIQNNLLSGTVPDWIWSLPMVHYLEIRNNFFRGSISPAIASAKNLTQLMISSNNFSGKIPPEICNLSQLSVIDVKHNNLSGDLPHCITKLTKLEKLDLQSNGFTGEIKVGSWQGLTELNLSCNKFSGEIPAKLGDLPVLTYLDLSLNRLSGNIPVELINLRANSFNLSYNNLSGKIPATFATEFYVPSLLGNPNLCSDASLPPFSLCSRKPINSLKAPTRTALITAAVLFLAGVAFLSGFCWIHYRKRMRTKSKRVRPRAPWKLTSFQRVGLTESDIFDCLREDNLIGSGGSGRVYKATLKTGQDVAVKKLWSGSREPQAEKDFRSEVETLGRVRHGNIVKLLFCCAAEDVRLLVYEYMENGSLGDVLHCEKGGTLLDWDRRVKIAVGSAQGLAYLHHDCVPPIVHRDVKANNILLDGEFCAHVADFGLARILKRIGEDDDERVVTRVVGSCGYIAPEYAYTLKVNEKSDVYSFGVVLLELVTGRKAIEQEFGEGKDIVRWSSETMAAVQAKEQGSEEVELDLKNMLDPRLNPTPFEYEDMVRVLKIGLLCTSSFPINRPTMRNVVEMLKDRRHMSSSAHVSSN